MLARVRRPLALLSILLLLTHGPTSPAQASTVTAPHDCGPAPGSHRSTPAPSFNCTKASSGSEKLICSDAELAELDARLADGYHRLLSMTDDPADLKQKQAGWLKATRNACRTTACMKSAYRARIDDLETTAQYLSKPAEFR